MSAQLAIDFDAIPARRGMCPTHRAEWMAWLDWVGSPSCRQYTARIVLVSIGQDNPARIEESLQARADGVYRLVRDQQSAIRRSCAERSGCRTDA